MLQKLAARSEISQTSPRKHPYRLDWVRVTLPDYSMQQVHPSWISVAPALTLQESLERSPLPRSYSEILCLMALHPGPGYRDMTQISFQVCSNGWSAKCLIQDRMGRQKKIWVTFHDERVFHEEQ